MAQEKIHRREIVLITKSEAGTGDHRWSKLETISKILSIAAIPVVLAIGGWYVQRRLQSQTEYMQRELQNQSISRDYVQLAVSILKEPDRAKVNPLLREWAVDLLNANSPTKFSPDVAEQLKSGEQILPTTGNDLGNIRNNGLVTNFGEAGTLTTKKDSYFESLKVSVIR